jgi:beta-glucosidase
VLLKNTADLLPLAPTQSLAVIGAFAKQPRYQGSGSSLMNPSQLDTAYAELCARVAPTVAVGYADGYAPRATEPDEHRIAEAVQVAQNADVVLLFVGLPDVFETEGIDRDHMRMPASHLALIEAVAAVHQRVVVVLSNGSPIEMPWHDQVAAIVEGYLGGQAGGSAIVDVLYGDVNPSGKLSETFPFQWQDHPAHRYFPGNHHRVEYRESVYVGYRYYDSAQRPVRFPFGHGLSYTTFAYSNLRFSATTIDEHAELTVTCTITNTGTRAGKEVVQLYVRDHESTQFRPSHELKGFTKVSLEPGASCEVTFTLDRRAFAYYDVASADWVVETGQFTVEVAASSRDIRLHGDVFVRGASVAPVPHREALQPYYAIGEQTDFAVAAFAHLLGPVTAMPVPRRGNYTLNTPISDMHESLVARLLHRQLATQMNKMVPLDDDTPTSIMFRNMLKEMPLRSLLMFAGPALGVRRLEMILDVINGHLGSAIRRWWRV